MRPTPPHLAPHVRLLLTALADPASCQALAPGAWDTLVRTARSARLLGLLEARIERAGLAECLPEPVANHLRAAKAEAQYLEQMTLRQLSVVAETLRPVGTRLLALKGSAYILCGDECSAGRLPRDVDIMVARERLGDVERALLSAGWQFQKTDPYDQHYYRAWSHELPPLRAPAMPLELDVHHSILPPVGRLRLDAGDLFDAAVPAVDDGPWWTLCQADRVLHAAAHLFQDSDCTDRLRDLFDVDMMLREFASADPDFWNVLVDRAHRLGLGRPLWYALRFCAAWLGTPVPEGVAGKCGRFAPAGFAGRLTAALVSRVLPPTDPDAEASLLDRGASAALEFRALWLRMPPWTLAYHGASKLVRSMRRTPASPAAG